MHIHVHHGFILGEGGGQGGAFAIPWQTFTPLEIHVVSDLLYTKVYVASSPLEFFNSCIAPLVQNSQCTTDYSQPQERENRTERAK